MRLMKNIPLDNRKYSQSATCLDSVYICPIFSVRQAEVDGDAYLLEFGDDDSLISYINQAAAGVLTLSTCIGWRNQCFTV